MAFNLLSECQAIAPAGYGNQSMRATVIQRLLWGQISLVDIPPADGYASAPDCSQIGEFIWVRSAGGWSHMLIADCQLGINEQDLAFIANYPYLLSWPDNHARSAALVIIP